METTKGLIDIYGTSKKSEVGRWVRAAQSVGAQQAIMQMLQKRKSLPKAYIFDNPPLP